jgi:hypothetical protein
MTIFFRTGRRIFQIYKIKNIPNRRLMINASFWGRGNQGKTENFKKKITR